MGSRETTTDKICRVELDYPLGHHARTLLQICPNFVEPVEKNIWTYEDRHLWDLEIEFKKVNDMDPDLGDEGLGPDVDNGIDEK